MKLQKVGMRTIKTGIAVAVCTLLAKYLVHNPMYAGVGCVVSVQDTVKGSFKLGFNRITGTFIGGLVGFLCVLISNVLIILLYFKTNEFQYMFSIIKDKGNKLINRRK